jgi:hypothetical protein
MSRSSQSAGSGFLPLNPLPPTPIIVTPKDDPATAPRPIEYYLNGFIRHHEKLSGMAGDRHSNKLRACVQNNQTHPTDAKETEDEQ